MKKICTLLIFIFIALAIAIVLSNSNYFYLKKIKPEQPNLETTGPKKREIVMTKDKSSESGDEAEISSLPKITILDLSQIDYFIQILRSAEKILQKTSTLDREKKLLGEGNFFWPKDPAKPTELIKLYTTFQLRGLAMRFERVARSEPWTKASISVAPPNFPKGCYRIKLQSSILPKLVLKDVSYKDNPDQNPRKIKISTYLLAKNSNMQYQFFEDAELEPSDEFPDQFFAIEISSLVH